MVTAAVNMAGQPAAREILRRGVARDELGHALLLVGPAGVGQDALVRELTAAVNCPDAVDGRGCGTCSTCRRSARGVHPALVRLEPEGAFHLVDAVRDEWIPRVSRTLVEGRRRIVHIVAAHRMNETAQNAFLKVLEEPPESTLWVLDAATTQPLLDTIISRCRRLEMRAWRPEALRHHGRELGLDGPGATAARQLGIDGDILEILTRAAQGSPTRLEGYADEYLNDVVEWMCPTCWAISVRERDETTSVCENKQCRSVTDGVPEALVWMPARRRHLEVIHRLAQRGPVAVGLIAAEVQAWADRHSATMEQGQLEELARLADELGARTDRDWPAGLKNRVRQRHKREQRQARLTALDRFLDEFGTYLRDIVAVQAGAGDDGIVNLDMTAQLQLDARSLPQPAALAALAMIPTLAEAMTIHSAQPRLQIERLLLPVAVAIYANDPPASGVR